MQHEAFVVLLQCLRLLAQTKAGAQGVSCALLAKEAGRDGGELSEGVQSVRVGLTSRHGEIVSAAVGVVLGMLQVRPACVSFILEEYISAD